MNRSQSPSETLHRVRCLREHRVKITRLMPIEFEPAPVVVIEIKQPEWRKLTGAERVKRWRDSHKS